MISSPSGAIVRFFMELLKKSDDLFARFMEK